MSKIRSLLAAAFIIAATLPAAATAQAPTAAQFEQTLEAKLLKLKPEGYTVRTILFEDTRAGTPHGPYFPFQVTLSIHDYGPGYPPNHYYGATCVGRMEKWKFDMKRDDFGQWMVEGAMTVSGSTCKDNPSEGASSIPLNTVAGRPARRSVVIGPQNPPKRVSVELYLGEWACYGTRGRLMAGMGFVLERGGKYHDTDGRRAGTYSYDAGASTISFRGGFLSGQRGSATRSAGIQLTPTVSCEPWR